MLVNLFLWIQVILLSVYANSPVSFSNCGGSLPAQLSSVTVEKTRNGNSLLINVNAQGYSSTQITGGLVSTSASVLGISLFSDQSDICSILGGCPSGPGNVAAQKVFTIDKVNAVWGVDVVGRMEWYDVTGAKIGCVETQFSLTEENTTAEVIANAVVYTIVIGTCIVAVTTSGTVWMISSQGSSTIGTITAASPASVPHSLFPGVVDFVLFLQFLSQTAMLNLQYPAYYLDIVMKFGWANFIPANIDFLKSITQILSGSPPTTPTTQTINADDTSGFAKIAFSIGIKPSEIFLYTSVVFIFVIFLWIVFALVIRLLLELFYLLLIRLMQLSRVDNGNAGWIPRRKYFLFTLGNVVRLFYLGYFILVSTSIYQLTRRDDSWALYVWAGIVLAGFCGLIMGTISIYLLKFRKRPEPLFKEDKKYLTVGPLYNQYAIGTYSFFTIFVIYRLFAGAIIGGAYFSPLAQMIALLVVELGYLFLLGIKHPLKTRFANKMHIYASILRVIAAGLLIAFIREVEAPVDTKNIIGYVILGLNGLAILFYSFVIIRNMIRMCQKKKIKRKEQLVAQTPMKQVQADDELFFPNSPIEIVSETESFEHISHLKAQSEDLNFDTYGMPIRNVAPKKSPLQRPFRHSALTRTPVDHEEVTMQG